MHADVTGMIRRKSFLPVLSLFILAGCASMEEDMYKNTVTVFATRYTAAWCSRSAASVAEFFSKKGSLKINEGAPAVGRPAITKAVQGFMTAFPDMVVKMDGLRVDTGTVVYRWTLTGTNAGPGGTGNSVRISGYEEWTIGSDGLIQSSKGHYDEADYQRQLKASSTRK
jgi:hypothetical protein